MFDLGYKLEEAVWGGQLEGAGVCECAIGTGLDAAPSSAV